MSVLLSASGARLVTTDPGDETTRLAPTGAEDEIICFTMTGPKGMITHLAVRELGARSLV